MLFWKKRKLQQRHDKKETYLKMRKQMLDTYLRIKIGEISESGWRCETIIVINRRLLNTKWIRIRVHEWIRCRRRCRRGRRGPQRTSRTLARSRRGRSWRWLFRLLRWKSRTRTFGTRRRVKIREWIVAEWILRVLNRKLNRCLNFFLSL